MNRFYRGDLVLWPGEPWARGPWEVIEDGPMVSPVTGGQTVTSYLIRPHRGAGDSYRVDAGSLTRYTRIEDAYEVGTRVIWEPQGHRRRALTGMSLALVTEAQVGIIESTQNNPQWVGDVLLRFPTDRGDWMQFAWRADCRRAPAESVRPMTATQVMDARRAVMSSADVTEIMFNGERLYRARDGQCFTTMTAAMHHNSIVEQLRAARGPVVMSPADELLMEQVRASSVMPALTRTQREQVLGIDLASSPDQTAVATLDLRKLVTERRALHGVRLGDDLDPPPPPTVIGGKRKLKL